MKASKRTIINNVMKGFDQHGWMVVDHYDRTPMTEVMKPLFDYLERIGVELK